MADGGVQSLERAVNLLRALAAGGATGMRLTDLCGESRLSKGTAHRLLSALITEGLVEHDGESRRYRLGMEMFRLGCATGARRSIQGLAAPALARLSESTGDSVFLSVRHGFNALCIDRLEGSYPVRTLEVDVGSLVPLGVAAGGMALMAFLSDYEVREIIAHVVSISDGRAAMTADALWEQVEETRRLGYAFNEGQMLPGVNTVGAPVFDAGGHPIAAVSLAAVSERLSGERRTEVISAVVEETRRVSARFAAPQRTTGARTARRPADGGHGGKGNMGESRIG